MKKQLYPVPAVVSGLALAVIATSTAAQPISEQTVFDAQKTWGEGIVAIAKFMPMAATTPPVRRNTSETFMRMARPRSCLSRPWQR